MSKLLYKKKIAEILWVKNAFLIDKYDIYVYVSVHAC